MKNLNITFEDSDFEKLNNLRLKLFNGGMKFTSWEKFILYLIGEKE